MKISLIIPAFDEERRLPGTLARVAEYLSGRTEEEWEVLVVDDGSRDATAEVASRAARGFPVPLRVISLPANRGKGAAIRAGVLESTGDRVLISDADLSTPIEEWEKLRDTGAPVAIGSRALDERLLLARQPWYRQTMGKAFNRLVRLFSIRGIRDTQCGFKLFDATLAREIFGRARIDGFAYDVEILRLARRRGAAISEVPVVWSNSPESKVSIVKDSLKMLRDLIRIRFVKPGS